MRQVLNRAMNCSNCTYENDSSASFCLHCGQRLALLCSQCGKSLPSNARFCDACGAQVIQASPPPSPQIEAASAPPESKEPSSFANGRYDVKRFLGEGGKKKVYLAQDTLLDREVAFALIKTEGLDEVSRTRITREAQAMGRLGSHPHIVTVFDLGQEADQPYMVTELMGGGDVEGRQRHHQDP